MHRIRRLLPAGLRCRLTAWVAGVLLVCAGAVFAVVYHETGSRLRDQIDRDMTVATRQMAVALRPSAGLSPAAISAAASEYLRAQPYTAGSTVLFAPAIAPADRGRASSWCCRDSRAGHD
jgi:hypothetical protein